MERLIEILIQRQEDNIKRHEYDRAAEDAVIIGMLEDMGDDCK